MSPQQKHATLPIILLPVTHYPINQTKKATRWFRLCQEETIPGCQPLALHYRGARWASGAEGTWIWMIEGIEEDEDETGAENTEGHAKLQL